MTETKRALVLVCALSIATSVAAQEKLPPTEILHLMFHEIAKNPDAQRTALTVPLMKRVETEGLSEEERFALGEVYFTNLQPVESKAAFEPFMSGTGERAAMAWVRVMQILFRAEGKADEVARMLPKYRERFPASPDNAYGATSQVRNIANLYKEKGDHAGVVELVESELVQLDFDAPYRSWLLPGMFFESYAAVGRADEATKYLRDAHAHYSEAIEHLPTPSRAFLEHEHVEGLLHRIEDHFYGSLVESDDAGVLRAMRTRSLVGALEKHLSEKHP